MSVNKNTWRVSWHDGMFLLPQHFQQSERHWEGYLNDRMTAQSPLSWGVQELVIDETELDRESLLIMRCRVVMPDGTTVNIPHQEAPPSARQIELPLDRKSLNVFLSVPRPAMPLFTANGDRSDIRYHEVKHDVADDHDPDRVQSIHIGAKNVQILFSEERTGSVFIKIAEIQRGADRKFVVRPDYIPPCPTLQGAPALVRLLRDLVSEVGVRATSIATSRAQRRESLDSSPAELLFLHLLSSQVAVLRHLCESAASTHPLTAYQELLRLYGGLSTFMRADPLQCPAYQHDALTTCFGLLEGQIREILRTAQFKPPYFLIPLTLQRQQNYQYWEGHIADAELLRSGRFFLIVSMESATANPQFQNVEMYKLFDLESLDRGVLGATKGVPVSRVQQLPEGAPRFEGGNVLFLEVQPHGAEWERVLRSKRLAINVPVWMTVGLKLELLCMPPPSRREGAHGR